MAISPTISLGRVSGSASSLRSTVSQTGKTTNLIRNTLNLGISRKRNLWNSTKILKNKRNDFERQQSTKDLRVAPILSARKGGAISLAQTDKSTSITDRLLGFVKYFAAGWILGNLPSWIYYGEQFVERLGTAGSILSNYGDETLRVMTSLGDLFKSTLKNVSSFDFSDKSGLMRSSLAELTGALGDLGTGLSEALDVLFAPFKELPKPEEPTPPPTTPTTPTTPSGPGGTEKNPDYWTLVAITALEDSDPQGRADVAQSIYNRAAAGVFPGGKNIRNIIIAEDGKQYEPVRRAVKQFRQINDRESAIKAIMVADGLSRKTAEQMIDNTASAINNPTLQRNAAQYIENRTDFVGAGLYPDRPSSTDLKRRNSRDNIFGNFVGSGSYEYGRRTKGRASSVPNFGSSQTSAPPAPSRPTPQPSTSTSRTPEELRRLFPSVSGTTGRSMVYNPNQSVSIPYNPIRNGGSITSVMGWRSLNGERPRMHNGWDISAPAGTPMYAYFPGIITHENRLPPEPNGRHGAGYGYWIIWKDDIYGAYHFFGHMLKPAEVRKGQRFEQGRLLGYIGSTGRSTGPHLHWEISKTVPREDGEFTSREDPGVWLKNHPLRSAQSVQISSNAVPTTPLIPPSQPPKDQGTNPPIQGRASQINAAEGITQERRGQTILVFDDRSTPAAQQIMPSSDISLSTQVDESFLLNNFIKNKLLLDLNYV